MVCDLLREHTGSLLGTTTLGTKGCDFVDLFSSLKFKLFIYYLNHKLIFYWLIRINGCFFYFYAYTILNKCFWFNHNCHIFVKIIVWA